ncbi:TPA: hypothetical protein EYP66_05760 [Candidatus Poribacteria bacterium]|nr:hypothetical protein [Candidatus Poribacteria bacterium]
MNKFKTYLEFIRYPLFAIPIVATLPGIVLASDKFTWQAPLAFVGRDSHLDFSPMYGGMQEGVSNLEIRYFNFAQYRLYEFIFRENST